jgi:hypothetical protein
MVRIALKFAAGVTEERAREVTPTVPEALRGIGGHPGNGRTTTVFRTRTCQMYYARSGAQ